MFHQSGPVWWLLDCVWLWLLTSGLILTSGFTPSLNLDLPRLPWSLELLAESAAVSGPSLLASLGMGPCSAGSITALGSLFLREQLALAALRHNLPQNVQLLFVHRLLCQVDSQILEQWRLSGMLYKVPISPKSLWALLLVVTKLGLPFKKMQSPNNLTSV